MIDVKNPLDSLARLDALLTAIEFYSDLEENNETTKQFLIMAAETAKKLDVWCLEKLEVLHGKIKVLEKLDLGETR